MKIFTITENEAGQRLDRFLGKLLPGAPASFVYKMLRKKNITLNGKKAEGSVKLSYGDEVRLFLSDETIGGFSRNLPAASGNRLPESCQTAADENGHAAAGNSTAGIKPQTRRLREKDIIFENKDIIIINKPAGILSQKALADDISVNELIASYMLDKGELGPEDMRAFRPAVCNRLDRNTSGVILAGKSLAGLRYLSGLLRERLLAKYYYALVKGEDLPPREVKAYLTKDENSNTVKITMKPSQSASRGSAAGKPALICTRMRQLSCGGGFALLEIELVTGKPHQVRAQLASIGYPVVGDIKYGDEAVNKLFFKNCHLKRQLLHARRVVFPHSDIYEDISGKEFVAELPPDFKYALKTLGMDSWS